MKSRYSIYILVFVALLPMLILRDFTPRNELRYLSIVDEALRDGHFFTFAHHGEVYADKPPLYFWAMMLGKWLLGSHQMWFIGLLSLLPALLTVGVMDRWMRGVVGESLRPVGQLMLMCCGLYLVSAVVLRMDMLMTLFITLSLYTFWRWHFSVQQMPAERARRQSARYSWLFPLYLFLGLFTKGPYGLLIPLVSITVYLACSKEISRWTKYFGWKTWSVLLLLTAAWIGAALMEGGSEYIDNLLLKQTVGRATKSFAHDNPPYYYLLTIWYAMLPWSLGVVGTIVYCAVKRRIEHPLQKFSLTIILATLVMLSIVSAKIDIYLLPIYPFAVYLALSLLPKTEDASWLRWLFIVPSGVFALALPAVLYCAKNIPELVYLDAHVVTAAALLLTVGSVNAVMMFHQRRVVRGVVVQCVGVLSALFLVGFALPQANDYLGYGKIAEKALELGRKHNIDTYVGCKLFRCVNMDAYIGRPVSFVESEVADTTKWSKCIFMLTDRARAEMRNIPPSVEIERVGCTDILVID